MLFVASNASDWWMTTFTPYSSDQMIRNLSMKIGEVDSGSARLLCDHLVAAGGVKVVIHQSLALLAIDSM